ncbi:serine/threonine protein kinase, partial [Myxococcota bacterium]|nr:serine/threonine protein kinase [Myxococcota bacterium]
RIGDHYFIAMEAVDGKDLKSVLRRLGERGETLDPLFAAWICQQAARGLDYAHKKKDPEGNDLSIVHRDVSPSNVLLSYEGAVKIADFGIAKAQGTTFDTKEGVLKGKFEYMSPEQAWGRPIDRRSDVFSLGTVLWEMLTGHRLFKGASDMDTLERIRSAAVRPPRELRPDLPEALEAAVLRALSPDPDDRYPD